MDVKYEEEKMEFVRVEIFVYLSTETTVAEVLRHTKQTQTKAGLQAAQLLADHLREEGGTHILQFKFLACSEINKRLITEPYPLAIRKNVVTLI